MNIKQSRMQPIAIPQVDRRHANPASSVITLVILADGLAPVLTRLGGTVFAEAGIN